MRIDSHQHFWKYNHIKHSWIDDNMTELRKDFLPEYLHPLLQKHQFEGCVTIQCETTTEEIHSMLDYASENIFIKGIVGWIDLTSDDVEKELEYFSNFSLLKGFRYVVQSEPDERFLLRKDFCRGIAELGKYNSTYDILIYPQQLPAAIEFVRLFPNQKFVLNHLAKPSIRNKEIEPWKRHIKELGKAQNVWCKLSGMVTEAEWNKWHQEDFIPYIDTVFEAFGAKRIMYGSDWPVCLLAASYDDVYHISQEYISKLSTEEQMDFYGRNAKTFYNLNT